MVRPSREEPRALFIGLCTFDIIQSVMRIPGPNEKATALRQVVAAGGPATNAAVAFAHLGGHASLITAVGTHALSRGMHADLQLAEVEVIDADVNESESPTVSSIMVIADSGERSVVSVNASGRSVKPPPQLNAMVSSVHTILIDGHHPDLVLSAARAASRYQRLCILDGGSWKDNMPDLLPLTDIAICSADFHPPGISTTHETLNYLLHSGVTWAAITNGAKPIIFAGPDVHSEIAVPFVNVVDTLGAGDIFHGAFAYAVSHASTVNKSSFIAAIEVATRVAAYSCQSFGTRTWMKSGSARALI
jgi:sugar/nucleoside kinase (ribokinase family)